MKLGSIPYAVRGRARTVLLGALAVVHASQPGTLHAQTPAGPEFHVNTYTTAGQLKADVAIAKSGDFVVTWESYTQDGDLFGIFAQRYDRAGNRAGAEFQVNTYTTGNQVVPHAAADARGNFVVVWASQGQDGNGYGIFGRRYEAAGNPRGGEFQVNTFTTGNQGGPSNTGTLSTHNVSMNASGSFVVVWHGNSATTPSTYGILARRYDRNGNAIGAEFLVNQNPAVTSRFPANKLANDGSFVVVWNSPDADADGVFGRRFNAAGSPIAAEFQVNQYTTGDQQDASVEFTGADGSFVVTWNSEGVDADGYAVMARRFDGSGNAVGAEFRVNTYTTGNQYGLPPKVRADEAGNFVVSWWSPQDGGGGGYGPLGVFGQRFAANGTRRGLEFQVNTYTTSFQDIPHLDVDPVGNFVVAWRSFSQLEYGGSVFAQRFGGLFPRALRVDTTGNNVWEPGEAVDVRPTWRNDNGVTQTFAATLSGITGPAGAAYAITDGIGAYGAVPNATDAPCIDCYTVLVENPAPRPVPHWDASALEAITPDTQGQQKRWLLHIGATFTDVSTTTNPFYRFIETLVHHGITSGCTLSQYCPLLSTSREQMAVFVLVGKEGAGYVPPACGATPVFADVPPSSPFCRWIEELFRRAVVTGCGGGNYCPRLDVSREQMAVFVLRTLDPALQPPACTTPIYNDVPASSGFCRWIEELTRRGVVTGCGGGNYCPIAPVTREQMGVFISVTFGLTLYGP